MCFILFVWFDESSGFYNPRGYSVFFSGYESADMVNQPSCSLTLYKYSTYYFGAYLFDDCVAGNGSYPSLRGRGTPAKLESTGVLLSALVRCRRK